MFIIKLIQKIKNNTIGFFIMLISSEGPSFSSLGPILKTTIKDQVHQAVTSSLSTKDKTFAMSGTLIELIKFYLPPGAKSYQYKVDLLDVTGLPLSGRLPFRVDLLAKGSYQALEAFFVLRKQFDQLTAAERDAVLKQLPEKFKS